MQAIYDKALTLKSDIELHVTEQPDSITRAQDERAIEQIEGKLQEVQGLLDVYDTEIDESIAKGELSRSQGGLDNLFIALFQSLTFLEEIARRQ